MKIEPTYVTFEQGKLLKKKEFKLEKCKEYFTDGTYSESNDPKGVFMEAVKHNKVISCLMPEQHQVVEWLRVNHGIWIYTYPVAPFVIDGEDYPKIVWVSKICSLNQVNFEKFIDADNGLAVNHHRSPQEAYSAAFDYILKELI
jgi:hypothetical protein